MFLSGSGSICAKCDLPVLKDTFHCEVCNVCVAGYSHHSVYLNTCIGSSNRANYSACLAGLSLAAAGELSTYVVLLALMIRDKQFTIYLNDKYSVWDYGYLFHLFVFFFMLTAFFLMVTSIIGCVFHAYIAIWDSRTVKKTIVKIKPVSYHSNFFRTTLRSEENSNIHPNKVSNLQEDSVDMTYSGELH